LRRTRIDDGVLVALENQDRSRWDQTLIAEGVAKLDQALAMRRTGNYQVQAAIAACHATAPDAVTTSQASTDAAGPPAATGGHRQPPAWLVRHPAAFTG
jgi:predicted RNA polymerase sigma factor